MKKDNRPEKPPDPGKLENAMGLGSAYLEYCVRKGWLKKSGEGLAVQYVLTEEGESKLANVQLNFDLSAISPRGAQPKKRRRRHKK